MFDDNKALDKWSSMVLNGKVDYELIKSGDNGFIKAESESACSALYYRIGFKAKEYPILSWKWKALKFPDKSHANTEKEKNDYAARVYVIFPFLNFSTSKFIEYVWAEDVPEGTILNSPDGKNIKMIVAKSGRTTGDDWMPESRNIYNDYKAAFGKAPNLDAGAIAIMCDSDNTKSAAEAFFDEITIASEITGEKRRIQ